MKFLRTGLAAAGFFIAVQSAGAQEQPLHVTVSGDATAFPAVDNETQAQAAIDAVPGGASLIDDSAWAGQRGDTVKDIVDYAPGVFAQPRNGDESQRLSIRGSGLATSFQGRGLLVLQDGIPINTADGSFEFPVIDPWLTKFAQVYRGANALEFGASTLGGAIDFTTPNGTSDPGINLRGEAGSFSTYHGLVSAGREYKDYDVFAAADGFAQGGFRDNNEQTTGRFAGNLGWTTGNFAQRIYISQTNNDVEIPGAVTKAQIDDDPTQANPFNLARHYERNLDVSRLGDRLTWQDGPQTLETTLYYQHRHLDNPVTTYEKQTSDDFGARGKYIYDFGQDKFTAGINNAYGQEEEHRYVDVASRAGARILNRNPNALTEEAYAQYEQHLAGALAGLVSTQASYAERNIHQTFPTDEKQNEHYAGVSPSVGLRYDLPDHGALYTNLSRSYEPPTLDDVSGGNNPGFSQIDSQDATTAEIGGRGRWRALNWETSYYYAWLRHEFVDYEFANGGGDTINVDRSIHEGIEAALSGDVRQDNFVDHDAFALRTAYTWSRFRLRNDPLYGDNTLPGVPEHFLRAELTYRHPSGISLGPNIEWVPKAYPVDITNTLYTSPYYLIGASGSWQVTERLQLYLDGRNLANRHYIATTNVVPNAGGVDGRDFFPGDGRSVFGGFRVRF